MSGRSILKLFYVLGKIRRLFCQRQKIDGNKPQTQANVAIRPNPSGKALRNTSAKEL
jgi:hypothetical protein